MFPNKNRIKISYLHIYLNLNLSRSYYSHDECLLICRMHSMQRYCGCVTPFLAPSLINASVCTLLQLPCLSHWMREFNQWSYFEYVEQSRGFDNCKHCLSTCNDVNYKSYLNYLPLRTAIGNDTYTFGLLWVTEFMRHFITFTIFVIIEKVLIASNHWHWWNCTSSNCMRNRHT